MGKNKGNPAIHVVDLEAARRFAGLLAHWLYSKVSGSYLFFRGLSVSATGQHDRTYYSSLIPASRKELNLPFPCLHSSHLLSDPTFTAHTDFSRVKSNT